LGAEPNIVGLEGDIEDQTKSQAKASYTFTTTETQVVEHIEVMKELIKLVETYFNNNIDSDDDMTD